MAGLFPSEFLFPLRPVPTEACSCLAKGVRFPWQRLVRNGGGAILADEMGLGKTVQVGI